jgi:ADP-ribose pyrophosphatase YjhB (NUDIX family)
MNNYIEKYKKYKYKYLEIKNQIGGKIMNACVALISTYGPTPGVYMVKGKENWNIPGGKIEKGESSLDAAIREFKEETGGHSIDNLRDRLNRNQYIYHDHTIIYYYVVSTQFNINFTPNNEKTLGSWVKISRVKNSNLKMRDSFRKSLIGVLNQAGF